jgi:hypothetical protein
LPLLLCCITLLPTLLHYTRHAFLHCLLVLWVCIAAITCDFEW